MKKKKSWDKKWYSDEFLYSLKATAKEKSQGDLTYIYKYPPDAISPFGIDPRMLGGPIGRTAKLLRFVPDFIFKHMHIKMDINSFRQQSKRVASATCIRAGVTVRNEKIKSEDSYEIPIRVYRSDDAPSKSRLLYFIHGGAFVGGALEPYDEFLKVYVSKFHMTAISVDYRLLPENPYPTLYKDCFCVLEYIYNNPEHFGIDKNNIFLSGDSAGGNLAQACSTFFKDKDIVRAQLLLYPSLNMYKKEDEYYSSSLDDFVFEPKQKALSMGVVRQMQMLGNVDMSLVGIEKEDIYNNPYSFSAEGNPPTFLSVGALDYLKKDAFAWAHKLKDAGVNIRLVVYGGMGHGFISAMGVFPQAEDAVDEMGEFMLENERKI